MYQTKLLYYPTISIPKNWAKTSLFYFDKISAIVPEGWDYDQFRLDPSNNAIFPAGNPDPYLDANEIEFLSSNNLYEKTNPRILWDTSRNKVTDFQKDFYQIFGSTSFQKDIKSAVKHFNNLSNDKIIHQSWIHDKKMDDEILKFLIKKKLAKPSMRNQSGFDYYIIENQTAAIYISLLAKHLSNVQGDSIISTDTIKNWQNISEPIGSYRKALCINVLLDDCLPSPDPNVSFEDIVNFKDHHKKDTMKIQHSISSFYQTISKEEDIDVVKDKAQDFSDSIRIDLEDLKESLDDISLQFKMKSLVSSISISAGLLSLLSAIPNPSQLTVPISLFGGAILSLASGYIDKSIAIRSRLRGSPNTLIYLAEREGIIS